MLSGDRFLRRTPVEHAANRFGIGLVASRYRRTKQLDSDGDRRTNQRGRSRQRLPHERSTRWFRIHGGATNVHRLV